MNNTDEIINSIIENEIGLLTSIYQNVNKDNLIISDYTKNPKLIALIKYCHETLLKEASKIETIDNLPQIIPVDNDESNAAQALLNLKDNNNIALSTGVLYQDNTKRVSFYSSNNLDINGDKMRMDFSSDNFLALVIDTILVWILKLDNQLFEVNSNTNSNKDLNKLLNNNIMEIQVMLVNIPGNYITTEITKLSNNSSIESSKLGGTRKRKRKTNTIKKTTKNSRHKRHKRHKKY